MEKHELIPGDGDDDEEYVEGANEDDDSPELTTTVDLLDQDHQRDLDEEFDFDSFQSLPMLPGQSYSTELGENPVIEAHSAISTVEEYEQSTNLENPLFSTGWNGGYFVDDLISNFDAAETCSLKPQLWTPDSSSFEIQPPLWTPSSSSFEIQPPLWKPSSSSFETSENANGKHDSSLGSGTYLVSAYNPKKRKDRDEADFSWEQTGSTNKKRPCDPYPDYFPLFKTARRSRSRGSRDCYSTIFPPQYEPSFVTGAADTKKRTSRGDALPPPSMSRSRGLTSQANSSEGSGLSSLSGKGSGMGNGDEPDGTDARPRCSCGRVLDALAISTSTMCDSCLVLTRMKQDKMVDNKIEGDESRSKPRRAHRLVIFPRRREPSNQQQPGSLAAPSSAI